MTPHSVLLSLRASSPPTRGLAGVLCAGFVLSQVNVLWELLAITPAYVMGNFYLWTGLTAGFMESSLVRLAGDLAGLFYISSLVLPIWGAKEFVFYVFLLNFLCTVTSMFAMVLAYGLTRNESYIFHPDGGFGGAMGGFSVVLWQLYPEQKLTIFVTMPFRARHLPLILCLVSGGWSAIWGSWYQFTLVISGVIYGWAYLRFYQSIDSLRGDYSKSFAFASLFPELLQPAVSVASDRIHHVAVALKIISKPQEDFSVLSRRNTGDVNMADQERQRQLGLRAINERLENAPATPPPARP